MAKKISSWKLKQRFAILAPKEFDYKEVGVTFADDPKKTIGRVADISLWELIGDKTKQHLKLLLEIFDVKGDKAYTRVKKFVTDPNYLRSLVRRGVTKVDHVLRVTFKDGCKAQIKVVVITHTKVSRPVKSEIIKVINRIIESHTKNDLNTFVQLAIFGKLGSEIFKEAKKITPIRRVEIEEIKVLSREKEMKVEELAEESKKEEVMVSA